MRPDRRNIGRAAWVVAVAVVLLLVVESSPPPSGAAGPAVASAKVPASPSKRWGAQMAYDPAEGYLLLFGGSGEGILENGVGYGDTWTYASGAWTDITPASCTNATCPREGAYGGLADYNKSGKSYMVLFGGRDAGVLTDSTWIFNGTWHNVTPSPLVPSTNSPSPLNYVAMTWDVKDRYDLLYGGCSAKCSATAGPPHETWAFQGLNATGRAVWKNLTTAVHPPPLYSEGLTYDAHDHYVLLFGGGVPGTETYLNQTWSYTAASGWVNRTSTAFNATNTPPFVGIIPGQLAYDPSFGSVVLFGGQHFWASPTAGDKTANATLNETWRYRAGVWKNVTEVVSPHPRFGAAMAYDVLNKTLVLFGGLSGTVENSPLLDDTWWYTGTWTNHTPT
jgi:hypothetical protein